VDESSYGHQSEHIRAQKNGSHHSRQDQTLGRRPSPFLYPALERPKLIGLVSVRILKPQPPHRGCRQRIGAIWSHLSNSDHAAADGSSRVRQYCTASDCLRWVARTTESPLHWPPARAFPPNPLPNLVRLSRNQTGSMPRDSRDAGPKSAKRTPG